MGARQNNLKDIELTVPLGAITAVTGVSGSGKSSLAFDTLYAEGQRRYVESFSPYVRQFMDRMDRPDVDRVEGVLPAVAIDQKNAIKASRSTVGTVTELTDYIKLIYARAAVLHCEGCGEPVRSDEPEAAADRLLDGEHAGRAMITFTVPPSPTIKGTRLALQWLVAEGYQRRLVASGDAAEVAPIEAADARAMRGEPLHVVADRLALVPRRRRRLVDSLEAAMTRGQGRASVWLEEGGALRQMRLSRGRHCAGCDRGYPEPLPNHFSYNSPLGACERCNGFGAIVGLDVDLVVPDKRRTLAGGAVKPWSTDSTGWEREELRAYCKKAKIPLDVPYGQLSTGQQQRIVEGDASCGWHGIRGWFGWLETRTYKMHVRVLLSRYRAYSACPDCGGSRLKRGALAYRLGGRDIGSLYRMSIGEARGFFDALELPPEPRAATAVVLDEIRARLRYLCDVGVDYLTLDRQSRTLSGGEVQRVNLTTAIGSALVNTLYVLDEPSVGLHPRDNDRLLAILERLRANRNTIVIVEHDEAIIRRCDHVVDLGPGPGERGGQVVYRGPPAKMATAAARSATARHLFGPKEGGARRAVGDGARGPRPVRARAPAITVRGARAHNLRQIDVAFPIGRLVVVTGVSGSGKSTLVERVLYRGLLRRRGLATDPPGSCEAIEGWEDLADVVLVDQSPVGTTPRSNPATYVKAFDGIRRLFAAEPQARMRGLSASAFSFNVPGGRCEACQGNGFERIEMQFLSDCFVTCDCCGGRRFKHDVLDVRLGGRESIDDVLRMTAAEATRRFADVPAVTRSLSALVDVGLGYLRLGQPLNTLSGGESQRLKLAAHLVLKRTEGVLLLLDEPTTGLHMADVARLVDNLQALVDQRNTVVVIEHHLDVVAAADWIIDLGPEGGGGGGRLVACGPPAALAERRDSHTGRHLARHLQRRVEPSSRRGRGEAAPAARPRYIAPADIVVRGARVNNLRGIDLRLPRDRLVVISGPSGSGKSSLAFDLLYAEGQRRFIDCLSPYARQYVAQIARPDLDQLQGVPPTVCISQRTSRGGRKSTVATMTEIYHYLRLLYARIGRQHCHRCGAAASGLRAEDLQQRIIAHHDGQRALLLAPAVRGRKGFHRDVLERALAAGCEQMRIDGKLVALRDDRLPKLARYREHDIDFVVASQRIAGDRTVALGRAVTRALSLGEGTLIVLPLDQRGRPRVSASRTYSQERYCADCGIGFEPLDPRTFSFNSSAGACPRCQGTGATTADGAAGDADRSVGELRRGARRRGKRRRGRRTRRARPGGSAGAYIDERTALAAAERRRGEAGGGASGDEIEPCPVCRGGRLRPEALAVRLGGRSIAELTAMSPAQLRAFIAGLQLSDRERKIASGALAEIDSRAAFLDRVGLDYLSLDRGAHTLSGGEAQRVRLAAQLSADLRGVLYILDEPTIGLHPVDNQRLLDALRALVRRGNTVVVVEHDEATIRQADHLLELGPGGGSEGGRVVASAPVREVLGRADSPTGQALARAAGQRAVWRDRPVEQRRSGETSPEGWIRLRGVRHHNLRGVDVDLPLARLTVVTGVSGSGKSSLVRDALGGDLRRLQRGEAPRLCAGLEGASQLRRVREIDQKPIGKTPASTPATYVGLLGDVRRLFAQLPEARARGYKPGRFSFNVRGGRCEHCSGQGQIRHEMSFLPDVHSPCEVCGGRRFAAETLQVRYREHSIADVLELTVGQARELFGAVPAIRRGLELLCDVGLDYLNLGQPSNTLSGGEAQRIKLVEELQKEGGCGTLYIMDEPSTGLHWVDLERLLVVLQRLVDRGDTVVIIEHNLDVIASADWIVDLGPGGGDRGGRLVHQGSRESLLRNRRRSLTGRYLGWHLGGVS